jgi:hypothetical protein
MGPRHTAVQVMHRFRDPKAASGTHSFFGMPVLLCLPPPVTAGAIRAALAQAVSRQAAAVTEHLRTLPGDAAAAAAAPAAAYEVHMSNTAGTTVLGDLPADDAAPVTWDPRRALVCDWPTSAAELPVFRVCAAEEEGKER